MDDEIKICRKCGAEYNPSAYHLGKDCRDCYRAGERERKAQERANALGAARRSCRDCHCELTKENQLPGSNRCKSCREKIKEANRLAYMRKLVASSMHSINREGEKRRDSPEPMGIPIYNPWW